MPQYNINLTSRSYQKLKLTVMQRNGTSASGCIYETTRAATPKKTAGSINSNYGSKTKKVAT
jgi:hypothetical protein